jgi:hypothetical protein
MGCSQWNTGRRQRPKCVLLHSQRVCPCKHGGQGDRAYVPIPLRQLYVSLHCFRYGQVVDPRSCAAAHVRARTRRIATPRSVLFDGCSKMSRRQPCSSVRIRSERGWLDAWPQAWISMADNPPTHATTSLETGRSLTGGFEKLFSFMRRIRSTLPKRPRSIYFSFRSMLAPWDQWRRLSFHPSTGLKVEQNGFRRHNDN